MQPNEIMPRCCVLLAAHNGENFIENQITTILNQKAVKIEIIVSLDKSEDKTKQILVNLEKRNSNLKVTKIGTFGSAAKNFYSLIESVDIRGYDFIAFSDQDDIWLDDKLINAISCMKSDSADGFSSDVISYWPTTKKKKLTKNSYMQTSYDHFFESPGPGCSHVFSTISFNNFQNFLKKNKEVVQDFDYHDWLIYAFYKENSYKWIISDVPKMLYVQHGANQIGTNAGIRGKLKRLRMIRSGWYKSQVLILAKLFNNAEIQDSLFKFMLKNCFSLRRRKAQSLLLFLLITLGIL